MQLRIQARFWQAQLRKKIWVCLAKIGFFFLFEVLNLGEICVYLLVKIKIELVIQFVLSMLGVVRSMKLEERSGFV